MQKILKDRQAELHQLSITRSVKNLSSHDRGQQRLYSQEGYCALSQIETEVLPTEIQMQTLRELMKDNGENIFDAEKEVPAYRKQYVVNFDSLDPINNHGFDLSFLRTFHEGFLKTVPESSVKCHYLLSILYSPANSTVIQLPHHDIDRKYKDKPGMAAILIGTQEDTTLHVYAKSHLDNIQEYHPKRLNLDPWRPVMFNGSLIHCGDKYITENIRFHYYKYPENIPFIDATYFPTLHTARKLQPVNIAQQIRLKKRNEDQEEKIKHRLARQSIAALASAAATEARNKKRKREEEDIYFVLD